MAEGSCSSASSCSKESCEGCASKAKTAANSFVAEPNPNSRVKHVIGVVSGKGGVGKSFVTGSLANAMAKAGFRVGILDGDITGPSIPRMYGVHGPAYADENGSFPVVSANGIKIMSINLMLKDEEAPVVWRGPVIAGAVKQFWSDVQWQDIDYMLVDMPPGTGDVPLTVFQSLPIDGIVVVTSPQELVQMIVKKAYNMAQMMNIPVLGLVENYSYIKCPCCGEEINIYGKSSIDAVAAQLDVPVLGKMPMDADFARSVDLGEMSRVNNPYLEQAVEVLKGIK